MTAVFPEGFMVSGLGRNRLTKTWQKATNCCLRLYLFTIPGSIGPLVALHQRLRLLVTVDTLLTLADRRCSGVDIAAFVYVIFAPFSFISLHRSDGTSSVQRYYHGVIFCVYPI